MIYEITHRTSYKYQSAVIQSQHLLHLAPCTMPRQQVKSSGIFIEPAPSWRREFTDYYGNPAVFVGIENEHTELVIHATSTVAVERPPEIALTEGPSWEEIAASARAGGGGADLSVIELALPSPATPASDAVLKFARASFGAGQPAVACAWSLTTRIFDEFKFDPTATDVTTPVDRVLELRRGVCQDFAHVALACLRAMGLPARYVSGYLLTRPPPGGRKLQGADASHAWVSVWLGQLGWVDFDPTNRLLPGDEHITFAIGREYGDVSPVVGVLLGGGHHEVAVSVDVEPVAA
jgi:transglutaminase-like putative cysteine protease